MDVLDSVQDAVDAVAQQAADMAAQVKLKADEAVEQVEASFKQNPLAVLAAALGLGFSIAVILSRPRVKIVYVRERP